MAKKGILSASIDELRYDDLKDDSLNSIDPLDKRNSKIVKTFDKDFGFAVAPGEKESISKYKSDVLGAAGQQRDALDYYNTQYSAAMKKADGTVAIELDKMAHSLDDAARWQQKKVAVSITGNGKIETTHYVNKDWAEKFLPQLSGLTEGFFNPIRYDNGSWSIDANGYGKELREAVMDAEAQTNAADVAYQEALKTARRTLAIEMETAKKSINSQRRMAEARHNFEVNRANAIIARTEGLWSNYLTNSQAAFQRGIRDNTGGINDLLKSGALVLKGGTK